MNFKKAQTHLRENSEIIRLLVQEMTGEAARHKPDADSWSILEVINHLVDEEREDFREHRQPNLALQKAHHLSCRPGKP